MMFNNLLKPYRNKYSMRFDGDDKIVNVGNTSDFSYIQNTAVFSISIWHKLDDYTIGTNRYLMGNSNSSSTKGFFIEYNSASDTFRAVLNNGASNVIASSASSNLVSDNDWHHLCVVGNGTNIFFYYDNVGQTGSNTVATLSTGDSINTLTIGNLLAGGSNTWQGTFNNITLYDVELSSSEVSELYNLGNFKSLKEFSRFDDCQLWVDFTKAEYDAISTEFLIKDSSPNNISAMSQQSELEDRMFEAPE